jgi:cephalosporin-C deacetylase
MGMLALDINAHGIPNGKPNEYYEALSHGILKGYPLRGRDSRETSYFLGMYLRVIRAIDFLASLPEWDHRVLVVTGNSQGGGQAIAAAGLDSRVTLVAAGVPALCDHSAGTVGRTGGWPRLVPTGVDGQPDSRILQVSRYFDTVNFATQVKSQAIIAVGFIDAACPPSTVYAAYNSLKGPKQIIYEPLAGHVVTSRAGSTFAARIREHVQQAKGPAKQGFPIPWFRPTGLLSNYADQINIILRQPVWSLGIPTIICRPGDRVDAVAIAE